MLQNGQTKILKQCKIIHEISRRRRLNALYGCNKVYIFVTFIIVKLPMLVADIRISGARSRMDMLPDYFEAAATSKN